MLLCQLKYFPHLYPVTTTDRFSKAIAGFDAYNQRDPNVETYNGKAYPKEFLYAYRMTERLAAFAPDASEAVKLAARCQHIGRWEIPRKKYPMEKKGYLQWRNEEKFHHAAIAENILKDCGYGEETIEKVKALLLKKELFTNAETQLLEDVVCLVFIEFYLDDFVSKHDDDKVIDILRKTMRKMSRAGKESVAGLQLTEKAHSLIKCAADGQ